MLQAKRMGTELRAAALVGKEEMRCGDGDDGSAK
jgi:hypothetical protein